MAESTPPMEEIEMTVVEVGDLPERFRPPSRQQPSANSAASVPAPLAELIEEATGGLTAAERGALLSRLQEEKPDLFAGEMEAASREEWRERLVTWLKEKANRFMAAAAIL